MVAERQFQGRGKAKVFIFICAVTVVVLGGSCLFAVDTVRGPKEKGSNGVEGGTASEAAEGSRKAGSRHRVFSLKHISAEQGKKYLAEAGVGTVSQLPGVNALLVTARSEELVKASAILELVDAEELFYIKAIFPVSEVENLPSNEQVAAKIGDISIGTFSNPPSNTAKTRAIIDVHGDVVIAVAPVGQLERIVSAIEQLQSTEAQALQGSEPNKSAEMDGASGAKTETVTEAEFKRAAASFEPAGQADSSPSRVLRTAAGAEDDESDGLFNKLLNSIAEAKNSTAGHLAVEPNLPAVGSVDEGTAEKLESEPKAEPGPVLRGPQRQKRAFRDSLRPERKMGAEVAEPISEVRSPSPLPQGWGSYGPKSIADGNEMLELDLPERLNIIDLLDLVGKYLQLDYMYDETKVKGEVALRLQGPIKVKDLYPLLESVLKFKGFVMTRRGNLVTIAPAAEAVSLDPVLHPEVGEVQLGDVIITRVFKLKHIDTASAQNLLVSMKLGADISPIPETGTLIITGYAYRMARIEELLQMVDKPGEPRQFRFRQLKYTMATTLAPKIKTLAEQLGTVSITIAASSPTITRGPGESTTAFRARQRRAAAAAKEAPSGKGEVYLDADERTNRILMIGLEEQLIVIDSLIDSLDVEQQDLRSLRLYDIQHVGAEEVVKKLGELGIIGGGGRPTVRTSAEAKSARQGTPAPAVTSDIEPLVEEPQVVVIESTNSLLVNATPEQHTRIATIISYVDSVTLEQAIPYVIYPLENQSPEDLAGVLQQLIQETIKDKEGKIERTIRKIEEDIIIVPDESTFSIIVYASKKNQEWIGNLIKQLDKRRPQVLIDVSLVEITRDDEFEYDLNIIANAKDLVTGNIGVTGSVLPIAASIGNELEGGWNVSGVGKVEGFYAEDKIQALFTAMDRKDYGRVLAKPKVLVNDNEQGVIKTTEKTHVRTEIISWPGDPPHEVISVQYVPYEAKIELNITPNISEGDLLRLEIDMVREDYETRAPDPPDYTTSNINTIVTVPDGSTIILGGLTKLKQKKIGHKVPLLGDIPLVGGLFRTIDNSDETSKLYIFVKANILRPDETVGLAQLQQISSRNMAAFEEAERHFQEYESIPGVEPEPMDPLRVLEAE